MKKSLMFLIVLIGLILNAVSLLRADTQESVILSSLEYQENTRPVSISGANMDPERFASQLQKIADETGTIWVRTEYPSNENWQIKKHGTFPGHKWPADLFILAEGSLPETEDQFVATFETGDPDQTGRIADLMQNRKTSFGSMQQWVTQSGYIDGSYSVTGDPEKIEQAKQMLEDLLNLKPGSLEEIRLQVSNAEGPLSILYLCAILVFVIFTLMCLYYPVSERKEIGVKKLLGYSPWMIWKTMCGSLLFKAALLLIMADCILCLCIPDLPIRLGLNLFLESVLCVFLAACFSFLIILMATSMSISHVIKGEFHARMAQSVTGGLKLLLALMMVFFLPTIAETLTLAINQARALQVVNQRENTLVLDSFEYINDEFERFLAGDRSVQNKILEMFLELEQSANAGYFDSYAGRIEDIDTPQRITVNENSARELNILPADQLEELFSDQKIHILVPETWREADKEQLIENEKQEFNNPDEKDSSEIPEIAVHSYDSCDVYIPSQSSALFARGEWQMRDPAIVLVNDSWLAKRALTSNTGVNSPIRIKDTAQNRAAIEKAIVNAGLEANHPVFQRQSEVFAVQLQGIMTGMGVVLALLLLLLGISFLDSWIFIRILMSVKQKEILVRKLLGFSLVRRYQEIWEAEFISLFCSLCVLVMRRPDQTTGILFGMILLLDLLAMVLLLKRQEKKQLNLLLKGEGI